jgi:hypothetical protein
VFHNYLPEIYVAVDPSARLVRSGKGTAHTQFRLCGTGWAFIGL